MKKSVLSLLLVALVLGFSQCEKKTITTTDNSTIKDSIPQQKPDTIPDPYNGHAYVDLGLSVMWATCNVGATKPEEYGDHFSWGEIATKSDYSWNTYKWCKGSVDSLTKYSNTWGEVYDKKITLELEDDAAHANWGGVWRMPTKIEMKELVDNCTFTWTRKERDGSQYGVGGYDVKSNINGNVIFLPAAGRMRNSDRLDFGSDGRYWTSSLAIRSKNAIYLHFVSVFKDGSAEYERYNGLSVRPVCKK